MRIELNDSELDWALKHLIEFGGSDAFPPNQHFLAIQSNWEEVRSEIRRKLRSGNYSPSTPTFGMSPKSDCTFRAVHELHPIDIVIITAVVYAISDDLEKARIPEDKGRVFSYRISPNNEGGFFKKGSEGWSEFIAKRDRLFEEFSGGYVLQADITDFFNQIYLHRVQNAIEEALPTGKEQFAKFIHDFLLELNIRGSRGIPVGPAFSTILAEVLLIDVDNYINRKGLEFIRWVDDMYIFHENYWCLQNCYHDISEYLYSTHRLVFNGQKTQLGLVDFVSREHQEEGEAVARKHVLDLMESKYRQIWDNILINVHPYDYWDINWTDIEYSVSMQCEQEVLEDGSEAHAKSLEHAIEAHDFKLAKYILKSATVCEIRSVLHTVLENFELLVPLIREVSGYFLKVCKDEDARDLYKHVEDLCLKTNNGFVLRWLAYILYSTEIVKLEEIKPVLYSRFALPEELLLAAAWEDLPRIKKQRTKISEMSEHDKLMYILSTSKLTQDEQRPLLQKFKNSDNILEKSYYKYVMYLRREQTQSTQN